MGRLLDFALRGQFTCDPDRRVGRTRSTGAAIGIQGRLTGSASMAQVARMDVVRNPAPPRRVGEENGAVPGTSALRVSMQAANGMWRAKSQAPARGCWVCWCAPSKATSNKQRPPCLSKCHAEQLFAGGQSLALRSARSSGILSSLLETARSTTPYLGLGLDGSPRVDASWPRQILRWE